MGGLAGSESEEAVRLSLEVFPSLGGAKVVMIGAMIGGRGAGRGAGEDSSVGELGKFSTMDLIWVRGPGAGRGAGEDSSVGELGKFSSMDLIWVRGPGAGVVGRAMDKLSLPRTPREAVHKVCSGAGERGGEEWIIPLPDATGAFCFVSKLM